MESIQSGCSISYKERWIFFFLCLAIAACIVAASILAYAFLGEDVQIFKNLYVLPWVFLVFFTVSVPSVYLVARREFHLFHPLVFPAWSYFLPVFVLGSLYFATGRYEPHYLKLIGDPERHIPLALFYVALGFTSLSVGFFLNSAKRAGWSVAKRLPKWNWDIEKMILPFLLLLAIGRAFELRAFAAGAVGYQLLEDTASIGSTYYYFSILGYMANFLLWLTIFKASRLQLRHYLLILFLLLLIPYSVMISGGKGELVRNAIAILFAYWASGRKLRLRHGIVAGCLLVSAVLVGVTYGTMYRVVKGSESNVSFTENYELWDRTLDAVSQIDLMENLGIAAENAFQRLETITSLSVIVANYEQLRPLEDDYGLANNIWTYTWTAFIPRIVWPDKPVVSDARSMGTLYFEYGETSFSNTPMGDLLRNYGPAGVCLGMALLGFGLRIMYSAMMEGQGPSAWRSVTYFLLLTAVSYEGFYGTILPGLLRMGLIVLIGGVMVNVIHTSSKVLQKAVHAHRLNPKSCP